MWSFDDGLFVAQPEQQVDPVCGEEGIRIFADWSVTDTRAMASEVRRIDFILTVYRDGMPLGTSMTSHSWTSTPHIDASDSLDTPAVTIPPMTGSQLLEVVLDGKYYALNPAFPESVAETVVATILVDCSGNVTPYASVYWDELSCIKTGCQVHWIGLTGGGPGTVGYGVLSVGGACSWNLFEGDCSPQYLEFVPCDQSSTVFATAFQSLPVSMSTDSVDVTYTAPDCEQGVNAP